MATRGAPPSVAIASGWMSRQSDESSFNEVEVRTRVWAVSDVEELRWSLFRAIKDTHVMERKLLAAQNAKEASDVSHGREVERIEKERAEFKQTTAKMLRQSISRYKAEIKRDMELQLAGSTENDAQDSKVLSSKLHHSQGLVSRARDEIKRLQAECQRLRGEVALARKRAESATNKYTPLLRESQELRLSLASARDEALVREKHLLVQIQDVTAAHGRTRAKLKDIELKYVQLLNQYRGTILNSAVRSRQLASNLEAEAEAETGRRPFTVSALGPSGSGSGSELAGREGLHVVVPGAEAEADASLSHPDAGQRDGEHGNANASPSAIESEVEDLVAELDAEVAAMNQDMNMNMDGDGDGDDEMGLNLEDVGGAAREHERHRHRGATSGFGATSTSTSTSGSVSATEVETRLLEARRGVEAERERLASRKGTEPVPPPSFGAKAKTEAMTEAKTEAKTEVEGVEVEHEHEHDVDSEVEPRSEPSDRPRRRPQSARFARDSKTTSSTGTGTGPGSGSVSVPRLKLPLDNAVLFPMSAEKSFSSMRTGGGPEQAEAQGQGQGQGQTLRQRQRPQSALVGPMLRSVWDTLSARGGELWSESVGASHGTGLYPPSGSRTARTPRGLGAGAGAGAGTHKRPHTARGVRPRSRPRPRPKSASASVPDLQSEAKAQTMPAKSPRQKLTSGAGAGAGAGGVTLTLSSARRRPQSARMRVSSGSPGRAPDGDMGAPASARESGRDSQGHARRESQYAHAQAALQAQAHRPASAFESHRFSQQFAATSGLSLSGTSKGLVHPRASPGASTRA